MGRREGWGKVGGEEGEKDKWCQGEGLGAVIEEIVIIVYFLVDNVVKGHPYSKQTNNLNI